MAERPIFVPEPDEHHLVSEVFVSIRWHGGFSVSQKRKNVAELHKAAAKAGFSPVLEISSKSTSKVGQHLSAFHLKVRKNNREIPLESAFHGSKVFDHVGPFVGLCEGDPRAGNRDPRLRQS